MRAVVEHARPLGSAVKRLALFGALTLVLSVTVVGVRSDAEAAAGRLVYVSKVVTVEPPTAPEKFRKASALAECPQFTRAVGSGGAFVDQRGPSRIDLFDRPFNDKDTDRDDGAYVQAANSGPKPRNLRAVAVCMYNGRVPLPLLYHKSSYTVPGGQTFGGLTINCGVNSGDAESIGGGGGFDFNGNDVLQTSYPLGGWGVGLRGNNPDDRKVYVSAVCAKPADLDIEELSSGSIAVPPGTTDTRTVKCTDGRKASSGGAFGSAPRGRIVSSLPFDGNDEDGIPDDGWTIKYANPTASTVSYYAYAVCVK